MHQAHADATSSGPVSSLAFVDESMRRHPEAGTTWYFMAAGVLRGDRCAAVRELLVPLARRATRRIHWRDEELAAKGPIVDAVCAAEVESVVVVAAMRDPAKQERARKQVLKHLLYELDRVEVARAVLESRHTERDRHDLTSIGQFRNAGYLSRRLTVSHERPLQEPLLWLPDIIAGVVGDHRCGENDLIDRIRSLIELHDLGTV